MRITLLKRKMTRTTSMSSLAKMTWRIKEMTKMNRYRLSKAGINVKEGIERFNGNIDLYEKYLYSFLEDEYYDSMCEAIDEKDVKAAFTAAHALKGLAGNLSLVELHKDMLPLVESLRSGSIEDAISQLQLVIKDYNLISEALSQ